MHLNHHIVIHNCSMFKVEKITIKPAKLKRLNKSKFILLSKKESFKKQVHHLEHDGSKI